MERQGVMGLGVLRLGGEGFSQEVRRPWGARRMLILNLSMSGGRLDKPSLRKVVKGKGVNL